jgi:hypothetical protein
MPGRPHIYNKYVGVVIHFLLVVLFITAFASEFISIINPIKEIFQSLKFAQLSYRQRQWLQEGPLVKTVDDMLEHEYSETKGTCFVELPYDKLVIEGLGGKDTLIGPWAYLLYRTNYNLYPLPMDWGYSKDNKIYHIVFSWKITPESEPGSSTESHPCVFLITAKGDTVTITKIKDIGHAN